MDLKTHVDKKKYIFLPIIFKLKTNVDKTEKDMFFSKNISLAFLSSLYLTLSDFYVLPNS